MGASVDALQAGTQFRQFRRRCSSTTSPANPESRLNATLSAQSIPSVPFVTRPADADSDSFRSPDTTGVQVCQHTRTTK